MGTALEYGKTGLKIVTTTSSRPSPRLQALWPIPPIPVDKAALIDLALEPVAETGRKGIRITSRGSALPGDGSERWTLLHASYQGSAPSLLNWEEIPVGLKINLLVDQPMSSATHRFRLRCDAQGRSNLYPEVSIQTPADGTQGDLSNLKATIADIIADGKITDVEKPQLRRWLEDQRQRWVSAYDAAVAAGMSTSTEPLSGRRDNLWKPAYAYFAGILYSTTGSYDAYGCIGVTTARLGTAVLYPNQAAYDAAIASGDSLAINYMAWLTMLNGINNAPMAVRSDIAAKAATSTALGVVKPGPGLTVAADGTLQLSGGGTASWSGLAGAPTDSTPLMTLFAGKVGTSDPRLSDARPASDVYAWAKASTKPAYTAAEVGAVSTTGTAYNADRLGTYLQDLQTVVGGGDYILIRNQAAGKISLASYSSVASMVQGAATGAWNITASAADVVDGLHGSDLARKNADTGFTACQQFASPIEGPWYYQAAIQVRERGYLANTTAVNFENAPRIGFHWAGRYAAQLAYLGDEFHFLDGSCTGYKTLKVGDLGAAALTATTATVGDNAGYAFAGGGALDALVHGSGSSKFVDVWTNGVRRMRWSSTGAADFQGNSVSMGALTATNLTDGYITWNFAQLNRTGGNIELQWAGTSGNGVRLFGNSDHPVTFEGATGALTASGVIRSTSAYGWQIGESSGVPRVIWNGNFDFYTDANGWAPIRVGALTANGVADIAGQIYIGGFSGPSKGSIYKQASYGLTIAGATGAAYDLTLLTPSASVIAYNPTGTINMVFAGALAASGDVLLDAGGAVAGNTRKIRFSSWAGGGGYGSEIRHVNSDGSPNYLNPYLAFFVQATNTYLPGDMVEALRLEGDKKATFAGAATFNGATLTVTNTAGAFLQIGTGGNNGSNAAPLYHGINFLGASNYLTAQITSEDRLYNEWGTTLRFFTRRNDVANALQQHLVLAGNDKSTRAQGEVYALNDKLVYHAANIDTAPASLQALKALGNAPAIGPLPLPTLPSTTYPVGSYYYATDDTTADGQPGTLYKNTAGTWTMVGASLLIAGRIIAANITAGSIGATALASEIVLATIIRTTTATWVGTPFASGSYLSAGAMLYAASGGGAAGIYCGDEGIQIKRARIREANFIINRITNGLFYSNLNPWVTGSTGAAFAAAHSSTSRTGATGSARATGYVDIADGQTLSLTGAVSFSQLLKIPSKIVGVDPVVKLAYLASTDSPDVRLYNTAIGVYVQNVETGASEQVAATTSSLNADGAWHQVSLTLDASKLWPNGTADPGADFILKVQVNYTEQHRNQTGTGIRVTSTVHLDEVNLTI